MMNANRLLFIASLLSPLVIAPNAAPAAIIDPSTIAGMKLRLDANAITGLSDNQAVATWNDTSGNGLNATQSTGSFQPLYKTSIMNGKPVVRFDGSNDRMNEGLGLLGAQTWFVVCKQNNTSGNQTVLGLRAGGDASQLTFVNISGYQNVTFKMDALAGSQSVGFNPAHDTSGHMFAIAYNGGGGSATSSYPSLSYDQVSQTVLASGVSGLDNPGGLIGAQNLSTINFLNGDIAEIIIYNSVLSSTNYNGVQAYLYDKWFVTAPEPAGGVLLGVCAPLMLRRRRL
jgi:hypothetical protein